LNAEFSLSLNAEPLALYLCLLELEQSHPDEEIELIIDKLDKPQRLFDKPELSQNTKAGSTKWAATLICVTWSRVTAIVGSAVATLASCRIRIVRGHREPPRDCGTMAPGAGWLRAA
jgi:hypothetical protein